MWSSHLILCCPLFLLPPIPPTIRVFYSESTHHMRWPKYWSFSFSIIPSKEHPGLISFRMDWLDLLVVQGTLKSLLQHHSSKASIIRRSAFFIVQLSHPYMTHWKNHNLDQTDLCDLAKLSVLDTEPAEKTFCLWNWLVLFWGSKELWYQRSLCLSTEKNSGRAKW